MPRARLGLAIAKRQVRLAVQRNRVKRLVRESFRQARPTLRGVDLVVMARPRLAERSNRQLSESLLKHWQRISKGTSA